MNRLVIIKFSPDITGHLTIKRKDFWKISQIRGREAKIYFKRVFSLYYHHRMPWVGSDLNNQLVPTPLHPLDLVTHGPFSYTDFEWFSFTYNWCTSCWFWLNKSKNAFHFLFTFFHFLFFVFFSVLMYNTSFIFLCYGKHYSLKTCSSCARCVSLPVLDAPFFYSLSPMPNHMLN